MEVEQLRGLVLDALDRAGLNVQPVNARGSARLPGVLVMTGGHALMVVCANAEILTEIRRQQVDQPEPGPRRWTRRKA